MQKTKIKIKVFIRQLKDLLNGTYFKFSKRHKQPVDFQHSVSIKQEIKPSQTFDNKLYNLQLASQKINEYIILPNQVFSFWNIVGNPDEQFKKSRSIINGELSEETGGGLCQVSGIIYHVSLLSGIEVIERHNHSMDIYTDETRFTPLGTDATVVYGYKDLRLKNNYPFPIKFQMEIVDNTIQANILSLEKLEEKTLSFHPKNENDYIHIQVKDEKNTLLNQSKYKKM